MNTTGMTNIMMRMRIFLPQTISPYMVCPSNIVTYLKTQHFYNQLQDTVVRQLDPPHRRYPQTDFRFAPGWKFGFLLFGLWYRNLITGFSKETDGSVFPYILKNETAVTPKSW